MVTIYRIVTQTVTQMCFRSRARTRPDFFCSVRAHRLLIQNFLSIPAQSTVFAADHRIIRSACTKNRSLCMPDHISCVVHARPHSACSFWSQKSNPGALESSDDYLQEMRWHFDHRSTVFELHALYIRPRCGWRLIRVLSMISENKIARMQ